MTTAARPFAISLGVAGGGDALWVPKRQAGQDRSQARLGEPGNVDGRPLDSAALLRYAALIETWDAGESRPSEAGGPRCGVKGE